MSKSKNLAIAGFIKPGFEAVREAFVENFTRRHELGAAYCIYYRGQKVVDLWGGIRNKATGEPWEEETMVIVYSATKGLAGLAMALAQSRGLLDYDERVCTYWPEFAQQGKEQVTVRQLLSHQAGLFAFDAPVDKSVVADLDRLSVVLAQQKPAWEPGTRQAYHAISLGFYESELLRRVDPHHRSLGQFFQEEMASPLGLDFYIRLPEEIPNARLATIQPANPALAIFTVPIPFTLAVLDRRSPLHRALFENPGPSLPLDNERVWSARSGRIRWICRPASQGRVCVHPQPHGDLPGGSKRTGAAHRLLPLDWRDTPLHCARLRREGPPKHDEWTVIAVHS